MSISISHGLRAYGVASYSALIFPTVAMRSTAFQLFTGSRSLFFCRLASAVRLTPKAKEDAILGVEQFGSERVLKARVRAVPKQGCANEALERLIAKWLGLPPSSVAVVQGGKSRMKHVKISGDGDRLVRLFRALPLLLAQPSARDARLPLISKQRQGALG